MRSRTERPSVSDIKVTLSRFAMKRRLVLILEWLTLCPTCADLPLSSHRHVIGGGLSLKLKAAHRACLGNWPCLDRPRPEKFGAALSGDGGPIGAGRQGVKPVPPLQPAAVRGRRLAERHPQPRGGAGFALIEPR